MQMISFCGPSSNQVSIKFLGLALRNQGWSVRIVPVGFRRADVSAGDQERDADHR